MNPFKPDLNDNMKVKRNLSLIAFTNVLIITYTVLAMIYFGGELMAKNLSAAQAILMIIIPALISIVMQYFYIDSKQEKKNDSDT